jgi:hypothetical protein
MKTESRLTAMDKAIDALEADYAAHSTRKKALEMFLTQLTPTERMWITSERCSLEWLYDMRQRGEYVNLGGEQSDQRYTGD